MKELNLNIASNQKHLTGVKSKYNFNDVEKKKLAKATKDFESLLTSMMLKSMMPKESGIFGEGALGGKYFDSIFNLEFSKYISEKQGLGIAEKIYEKVVGEKMDPSLFPAKIKPGAVVPFNIKNDSNEILKPSNHSMERLRKYESIIKDAANTFGISDSLIKSVIMTESAARSDAVSKAKAKGLMQLMDATAMDLGVKDVFDARENIFGGTKYLSFLMDEFDNDLDLALAAYNAGPQNVKKHKGIPPFKETQNYVKRIKAYHNYFKD